MQSRMIRLIVVVFSSSTMLSVSYKYDSVNERTEKINQLMRLHMQGVGQNLLGNWLIVWTVSPFLYLSLWLREVPLTHCKSFT